MKRISIRLNSPILAFALLTASGVCSSVNAQTAPAWVVVATYKAENQTTPITSPITIFTSPQDGLFRVTAYLEITKSSADSQLTAYVLFDNDSDTQQLVPVTGEAFNNGIILTGSGGVTPIRVTAGTAISIEVLPVEFTQSVYNVYYTVEAFHSGT